MSKKDIKFIIVFTIAVILVLIELIVQKADLIIIILYAGLSILAPIGSYFAYKIACRHNRIENDLTEESPGNGDPTKMYVGFKKFRIWLIYCMYTLLVLFASVLI